MKTPREILLARHQAANAKLHEIRRAVVADLSPRQTRELEMPFLLKLWRELFWPCRRTWAGLSDPSTSTPEPPDTHVRAAESVWRSA